MLCYLVTQHRAVADDNRPYEFSFNIVDFQHRFEKKGISFERCEIEKQKFYHRQNKFAKKVSLNMIGLTCFVYSFIKMLRDLLTANTVSLRPTVFITRLDMPQTKTAIILSLNREIEK